MIPYHSLNDKSASSNETVRPSHSTNPVIDFHILENLKLPVHMKALEPVRTFTIIY